VDVDRSAAALADEVRSWAGGEFCHFVAHSMGGIVARRFIQKFPDVWASMQDKSGEKRGGRLVMMGTPNRGSYAIPLALSGEEKTVKSLAKLDFKHDRRNLLRILNTFVGSYQLLPSPKLELNGDDHRKLFAAATWGDLPVRQELLDRGKAFMAELDPVVDAGRLVFVGGYNQETPHRIHVDGPGRFRYESTLDGDGRVPHETALLEGVATFWVMEEHGDLPRNARVLAGIHDLLQKNTTAALETAEPRCAPPGRAPHTIRRRKKRRTRKWTRSRPGSSRAEPGRESRSRSQKRCRWRDWKASRLRPGSGSRRRRRRRRAESRRRVRSGRRPSPSWRRTFCGCASRWCGATSRAPPPTCWSPVSTAASPENALLALDRLVGPDELPARAPSRRAGALRGDLGDVEFLWRRPLVAVGGMGHSARSARRSCACSPAT
jgi:pimeloyl-ACP methyl ester carboxylesterase